MKNSLWWKTLGLMWHSSALCCSMYPCDEKFPVMKNVGTPCDDSLWWKTLGLMWHSSALCCSMYPCDEKLYFSYVLFRALVGTHVAIFGSLGLVCLFFYCISIICILSTHISRQVRTHVSFCKIEKICFTVNSTNAVIYQKTTAVNAYFW